MVPRRGGVGRVARACLRDAAGGAMIFPVDAVIATVAPRRSKAHAPAKLVAKPGTPFNCVSPDNPLRGPRARRFARHLTWIFAVGSESVNLKKQVAEKALEFVAPGMRLGLGSGSTSACFVDCVGEAVKNGLAIIGVPTSEATRRQAEALGIKLTTLDACPELDLTVDGADEFDPDLNLIKGGGGALLREKIVAASSKRMVVIADASKRVARLGAFPLPIEVAPFGLEFDQDTAAQGLGFARLERQGRAASSRRRNLRHRRRPLHPRLRPRRDSRSSAARGRARSPARRHGSRAFYRPGEPVVVAGASGVEVIGSKI